MLFADKDLDEIRAKVVALPGVERVTAGTFFPPSLGARLSSDDGGVDVYTVTFETGPDAITPVVTSGRAPAGPDEILVARPVAERLGVGIGDPVELTIPSLVDAFAAQLGVPPAAPQPDRTATLNVVGTGVIVNDLKSGVSMTLDGLSRLVTLTSDDEAALKARLSNEQLDDLAALRDAAIFRPGALMVDLRGGRPHALEVLPRAAPGWMVPKDGQDVIDQLIFLDLSRASRVPDALGGLFAVVFLGVAAHVVSSGVRARRHDLAILRTLGLRRRQVHAAVGWQASATIVASALLGIPLGVAVGRLAWERYARGLDVVAEAVTPWWWLAAIVALGVVVGNVVAVVPGWFTARRRAVEDLRAE
jgi:hypothetical protein